MTSCVWILLLASLVGTRAQEFDLSDAFDDDPKPTPKPVPKPPKTGGDGGFDLADAFEPDLPSEPKKPAVDPGKSGGNGDFNILDAFDDGKKPVPPKSGGGGGGFSDSDLEDVAGNGGYKPDAGHGGRGGGRASDYDSAGGQADQPQELSQQWLMLLKLLGDNIPEGLHEWIANSKQIVLTLLERVMGLLDLAEDKKEL